MIADLVEYVVTKKGRPQHIGRSLLECLASSIGEIAVYRHPLGFLHFDLTSIAQIEGGGFARLHIWDRQLSPPDPAGNVHDHTWQLHSLVLVGSLRDRTFQPFESAAGSMKAVQVIYGSTNEFIDSGTFDLRLVRDQIFTKGDIYTIPSRMVHESEVLSEPTVTFVVGIPDSHAKSNGPLIFSRDRAPVMGTPVREQVSSQLALDALMSVAQSLTEE